MAVKLACLAGLGLYVGLSIADYRLTFTLLTLGDGAAYEANPLAALFLDRHGWGGLAAFKAVMVVVFVGSVAFVMSRKKWVGVLLAVYGCALLAGVVLYSRQLVGEARQELAAREAKSALLASR